MGIFTPGMFRPRQSPDQAEHVIHEEVIARRPPVYCHACDINSHAAEDCPKLRAAEEVVQRAIRAHGAFFPGDSVIRGESLQDVLEGIKNFWGRTR